MSAVIKENEYGSERHARNPFIASYEKNIKIGEKRISSKSTGLCTIKNKTGEVLGTANFVHLVAVDKTAFVKMYSAGMIAQFGLDAAGKKLFMVLFDEIQKYPGTDKVYINFSIIDKIGTKMSSATYYRGMKSLLENKIIAKSKNQGIYFFNIQFMFNGDRLGFLKKFTSGAK